MTFFKHTLLGRLIPSITLLFTPTASVHTANTDIIGTTVNVATTTGGTMVLESTKIIVDSVVPVVIHTNCGTTVRVIAKIDTGADGSSIDEKFAERFCINEPYIANTKNKKCKNGLVSVRGQCRSRVVLKVSIAGRYVVGRASLSDKTDNRYPLIIGNREAIEAGIVVQPVYQTTTKNWDLNEYTEEMKK